MLPGTVFNHLSDSLLTDAEALSKRSLRGTVICPTLPNDADSIVVQLGVSVCRTVRNQLRMLSAVMPISRWSAFLGSHNAEVVKVRAKKEVVRPHAPGIIAVVTNFESPWDRAIGQLVGKTVSCNGSAATFYSDSETSVVLTVHAGNPDPAITGLVNLAPQADIKGQSVIGGIPATVTVNVDVPMVTVVLADTNGQSTAARTQRRGARIGLHSESPFQIRGATPGGVASTVRASLRPLYH